jgi:FkbM family methyltransferase
MGVVVPPMARAWLTSAAKYVADKAANTLPRPFVRRFLIAAALAPPPIKTRLYERICAKLARLSFSDPEECLRTNMGVASRLRCTIPLGKISYVFGRPHNNLPERATLALVRELSADCSHFIDVGANDGIFSFVVHETTHGSTGLHWFEPDREIYARLSNNLAVNKISSLGNHAAVSDRCGVATFYKNLSDDSSGSLGDYFAKRNEIRIETVEIVALHDYLAGLEIENAMVKIDVEGTGYEAWLGARNAIFRIKYLVMEMIDPEIERGLLEKIISDAGFCAYYIRDFELVHLTSISDYRYVSPFWNWLFCRLSPVQLTKRLAATNFAVLSTAK